MKLMASISAPLGSPAYSQSLYFSQRNAIESLGQSVQRLASGNRVLSIADDVAAVSLSSRLQAQISGLRQASQNIAQGLSLVQVASSGLRQIGDALIELESVASRANNSALSENDRAFLQQRFTTLIDSIDSVVGLTQFNSVTLLDGTLAGGTELSQQTQAASRAVGTLTFNASTSDGQTVSINNTLFEFGQTYNGVTLTSGTASASATSLAAVLNASNIEAVAQASYLAVGTDVEITSRAGGILSRQFIIDDGQGTADVSADGASGFVQGAIPPVTLIGGADNGVGIGNTKVTGTIGDLVINVQNQTPASRTLTITGAVVGTDTITFSGADSSTVFSFTNTPADQFDIKIGSTTEETLQNIVSTFSRFIGSLETAGADANDSRLELSQFKFEINGDTLIITNRQAGNAEAISINGGSETLSITSTGNVVASGANFNNGTTTGVNVNNVANPAFVGKISGFGATFVGADSVTASITVGNSVYSANITNTDPVGNTDIVFKSTAGGAFSVQLRGGEGSTVANQDDADDFAERLDDAFSTLTFYQERNVTNLKPEDTFAGSSARIQVKSTDTFTVSDAQVVASGANLNAIVRLSVNGGLFVSSSGLRDSIGAFESFVLRDTNDANQFITITNGANAFDLSDDAGAAAFETALKTAFQLEQDNLGTNFVVGVNASDVINVNLPSSNSTALFGGVTYDVTSQPNAAEAVTAVQAAQDTIQLLISYTSGKANAFNSAAVSVDAALTGVQAANSALADTDIIEESTSFAQKQLQVNASLAVIAQVLSLPRGLIGSLGSIGNS